MTDYDQLLGLYTAKMKKALIHLKYSYEKIKALPLQISKLNEEELEAWEGFIARFGRATDFFVAKYIRTAVLKGDPAFKGTVRDLLNSAEKIGLIEDVHIWLEIRSLRNSSAHDYDDERLEEAFKEIKKITPIVLDVEKKLK